VGYSKSNTSPVLELFVSRLDERMGLNQSDRDSGVAVT
jgi:hypothetical protein